MDGIKILIVVALFGIVASLGKAMFHMSSGRTDSVGQSAQMVACAHRPNRHSQLRCSCC